MMYSRLFFKGIVASLLLVVSSFRPAVHDFHTSLTQMQYNAKERMFEISVRVFTDDLERALSQESGHKIQLNASDTPNPLIEKYIRKHFALSTSPNAHKPYTYVGQEPEVDAYWLYLELPYTEPFKEATLRQDVLMEMFDDQVNLVNLQYGSQKKTVVFRKNQAVQGVRL